MLAKRAKAIRAIKLLARSLSYAATVAFVTTDHAPFFARVLIQRAM